MKIGSSNHWHKIIFQGHEVQKIKLFILRVKRNFATLAQKITHVEVNKWIQKFGILGFFTRNWLYALIDRWCWIRICFFIKQDFWHDFGNIIGSCVSRNTRISRKYNSYHTAPYFWFSRDKIYIFQPLKMQHSHLHYSLKINLLTTHHCNLI